MKYLRHFKTGTLALFAAMTMTYFLHDSHAQDGEAISSQNSNSLIFRNSTFEKPSISEKGGIIELPSKSLEDKGQEPANAQENVTDPRIIGQDNNVRGGTMAPLSRGGGMAPLSRGGGTVPFGDLESNERRFHFRLDDIQNLGSPRKEAPFGGPDIPK